MDAPPSEYHEYLGGRIHEDWEHICEEQAKMISMSLEQSEGTELLRAQGEMRLLRRLRPWARNHLDQILAEAKQEEQ
jgi:hypothetical protein